MSVAFCHTSNFLRGYPSPSPLMIPGRAKSLRIYASLEQKLTNHNMTATRCGMKTFEVKSEFRFGNESCDRYLEERETVPSFFVYSVNINMFVSKQ